MERIGKWLTVLRVVVKVLAAALAAVAADTAAGDPLRDAVLRAAALVEVPLAAAARASVPNVSSLSLLVLPLSVRVT